MSASVHACADTGRGQAICGPASGAVGHAARVALDGKDSGAGVTCVPTSPTQQVNFRRGPASASAGMPCAKLTTVSSCCSTRRTRFTRWSTSGLRRAVPTKMVRGRLRCKSCKRSFRSCRVSGHSEFRFECRSLAQHPASAMAREYDTGKSPSVDSNVLVSTAGKMPMATRCGFMKPLVDTLSSRMMSRFVPLTSALHATISGRFLCRYAV